MKLTKSEMTRRVVFLDINDDLKKADASMKALQIHHVPVLEKGRLVGMLSDRDVLAQGRWRGKTFLVPKKKVSEIISGRVITCSPDHSIARAADLMLKHEVHALPVVDENKELVGILTATDLLKILRDGEWSRDLPLPFVFEEPVRLLQLAN